MHTTSQKKTSDCIFDRKKGDTVWMGHPGPILWLFINRRAPIQYVRS